jgi:hypothetical protein
MSAEQREELTDEQCDRAVIEALKKVSHPAAWDVLTYGSGPYEITTVRPWVTSFAHHLLAHTAEPPINAAAQAALASDGNASLDYLGSNAHVNAPRTPPASAAPNEPVAPLPSADRLRAFIREKAPGGCKLLSQGTDCTCLLCDVDRLAERASPQAVPAELPSMPKYWQVEVHADGEKLVSIGESWLSGERALEQADEQTIIGAAKHLLAFVGYGLPPSRFNPDEDAPQAVDAPVAPSQICLPNGLPFDAFGEPRTRYVRVTLDGNHCVMHPVEGDRFIEEARANGDESAYVVADVYLSEREFDDLPEHDGF